MTLGFQLSTKAIDLDNVDAAKDDIHWDLDASFLIALSYCDINALQTIGELSMSMSNSF